MSVANDKGALKVCGCCGRSMAKAHAVNNRVQYCGTCYKREFRKAACTCCGRGFRHHASTPISRCPSCINGERRCLRCGKPVPQAGLVLAEGVVCPSCVRYFHEPQHCSACGAESVHLARAFKLGFTEPVCPRCRRKEHKTCPTCGKNRELAGTNAKGQSVCRKCLESAGRPFLCPVCGRQKKPHSGQRCEDCYWKATLATRLAASPPFSQEWVQRASDGYCRDLAVRIGAKRVYLRLERYLAFFKVLDTEFRREDDVSLDGLMAVFDRDGLRRGALPFGYIIKIGLLPDVTSGDLEVAADRYRQEQIVTRNAGTWRERPLADFLSHQLKLSKRYRDRGFVGNKRRYISRTVTTNVRAAEKFLTWLPEGIEKTFQLSQNDIDGFLTDHSGYREPLRSFIRFLRQRKRVFDKIKIFTVERNLNPKAILPHDRYLELIQSWLNPDKSRLKESIICLLMLLYAQQARKVSGLRMDQVRRKHNQLEIRFSDCWIKLDNRVARLLSRYLNERSALHSLDSGDNLYVFPGRYFRGPLSNATITGYLKHYGVSAMNLYSTGLRYAFLGGLRNPKALVAGLGVCDHTAIKYYEIANPRAAREAEASGALAPVDNQGE
jgi:hypothetical protein